MRQNYDPDSFFTFLGYGPANGTYYCRALPHLYVYCRGRRDQLERMLEPTPFLLADDRFVLSIADFANVANDDGRSSHGYIDGALILGVEFDGVRAGTYYYEWEDDHVSVAAGRELWGYPKHYADIVLAADEAGAHGEVGVGDALAFSVDVTWDDAMTDEGWRDVTVFPHYQVRAVPHVAGPGFQFFDVVRRNSDLDYRLISRRLGHAEVTLGPEITAGGEPLELVEVLGAEYKIGDYANTAVNGTPTVIASLV